MCCEKRPWHPTTAKVREKKREARVCGRKGEDRKGREEQRFHARRAPEGVEMAEIGAWFRSWSWFHFSMLIHVLLIFATHEASCSIPGADRFLVLTFFAGSCPGRDCFD